MTVETEVANLTTAVDNLTASVNVAKGTLDAKVSDAQTAEANAASHEVASLTAKNAAETAAASAVSVVQQDLSAISFDVPAGAVAICPIDPYEHGFVTWPVHGKQSWRSEARATGKYLGIAANEAGARAISGAADGDHYWNSGNQRVYELNAGSGQTQVFRAGSANFTPRWAVVYSAMVVLLQEDGSPWKVFPRGTSSGTYPFIWKSSSDARDVDFCSGRLVLATNANGNDSQDGLVVLDFNSDHAEKYENGANESGYWRYGLGTWGAGSGLPGIEGGSLPSIVNNAVNAVAATVLPDAPIKSGVPVPTIAVATDGGLSFIHNDGTVTSRAETEANMETTDVEFIGNSGAYRYQHEWSAGHDARVVYAPAEHLKDTSVLAYSADLYQSWETPVVGFSKTTYHANALRQMNNRTDPNGTSRVIAGDSMGGDQGITRVWHNEANPPASMVAYQADDHTTPPLFGDVKGAFLCEQGQAGTLVGATDADDFTGYADQVAAEAAGYVFTNTTLNPTTDAVEFPKLQSTEQLRFDQAFPQVANGDNYIFAVAVSGATTGSIVFQDNFANIYRMDSGTNITTVDGTYYFAGTKAGQLRFASSEWDGQIDSITQYVAHPDRSVNGKGLIVKGSLTQDADGWVSGFSATDYLEQPYNADLDLTGDFYAFVAVNAIGNGYLFARGEQGVNQPIYLRLFNGALRAAAGGAVDADVDFPSGSEGLVGLVLRGTTLEVWQLGSLVGTGAGTPNSSGVEDIFRIGIKTGGEANALTVGSIRRVVIGAGAPSHAQIKVMSDWVGDRLEGAFKDMHFEPSTKVLHVLTDAYHYEVDADGAILKSTPNTETWLKVTASRDGVVRNS